MPARIQVVSGDITTLRVDAIVNAANSALSGGGGVDGAIHRAAGGGLLAECRMLGRCPAGSAVVTAGHELPARWVIHAVGPVWHGGNDQEDSLLASCYRRSLEIAEEQGCESIAFPAISCGVYRFPLERACGIAVGTVREYFATYSESGIRRVVLVAFDSETAQQLRSALE